MTTISQEVPRVALCGHGYLSTTTQGRRRKFGDCSCKAQWTTKARSEAGRVASAARWGAARPDTCRHCSSPLPEFGLSSYCSKSCSNRASYARRRDGINAERRKRNAERLAQVVKDCPQCGQSFTPENTVSQRFCSRRCNVAYYRVSRVKRCSVEGCDRPLQARGMCGMHWRRWARATGREKAPEWDDRRRANYHKRRALKKKLPAADIRPRDIYERDSWVCGLCGDGIDPDAAWPDPLSASLDHILPLSKGGHHVPENVQAAHLSCNVRKGNRVEADAMSA